MHLIVEMGKKRGKSSSNKTLTSSSTMLPSPNENSVAVVAEWEAWKTKGNADFEHGGYQDAIHHYTTAVELLLKENCSGSMCKCILV